MTEKQYAPSAREKKVTTKKPAAAPMKVEEKKEIKMENKFEEKTETKIEDKKEIKTEDKKSKKKEEKIVKELAFVRGVSLSISPKHCYAICKMILGKTPDKAIELLERVLKYKFAVPMNNMEVPHRHGNLMAGRYPQNASKEMIQLLKQLKANASVNGIDNPVIVLAKANRASRPYKKEGRRAKRAHVYIEVRNKFDNLKK